jgi:hypothetical protein
MIFAAIIKQGRCELFPVEKIVTFFIFETGFLFTFKSAEFATEQLFIACVQIHLMNADSP